MKTKEEKSVRQFPPNLVNGSTKHPQMSKKIEVKVTKKKGRMLVAKDKIEPGKDINNINSGHSISNCGYHSLKLKLSSKISYQK